MKKTIEVLARRDCSQCHNKEPHGYTFEGSHGRESWVNCRCVPSTITRNENIAGKGKEWYWQEIEVEVPDKPQEAVAEVVSE